MRARRDAPARRTAYRATAAGTGGLLVALLLPPAAGLAQSGNACEHRANNTYAKLLECVTLDGVREHQAALQDIAEKNHDPDYPGTRADGTEGYEDSVEYVAELLDDAGYEVTREPVEFEFAFPATLRRLAPAEAEYETGPFTGSGSGAVEGTVAPIDVNLEKGDAAVSSSGCQPEDFAAVDWSGGTDIALVQRGGCFFGTKAFYAEEAGAEAVIIFNQGNTPEREELLVADATSVDPPITAQQPVTHGIPVVGASFADGQALAQEGSTVFVEVLETETRTADNVIAELPGRKDDNVVMAGAHLDSVIEGPGINDDGSGTAALLETALMMADTKPRNTLRFAWWAGEELGLLGSTAYVEGLSPKQRDRIALYMNYDMVGSPNSVQMVYDADQSTSEAPEGVTIPPGSDAIEDVYEAYYTRLGEPYDDTEFSGRSDYQAFIDNGIPAGGLFTGAEEIKSDAQQAIWGGTAGEQFDPCYHLACDTVDNVDLRALEVNSDLIAFAMQTFAYSTESVNGVPGKPVPGKPFALPAPAGPEGTFAGQGGGAAAGEGRPAA
jgi:hypothetical protein